MNAVAKITDIRNAAIVCTHKRLFPSYLNVVNKTRFTNFLVYSTLFAILFSKENGKPAFSLTSRFYLLLVGSKATHYTAYFSSPELNNACCIL